MKYRHLRSILAASFVAVIPVSGQESTKPATPSAAASAPQLLDQAKAIASAEKVTAEQYPDAKTVLVSEYVRTEYQSDGSYVTYDDEYIKVLTEEGRRSALEQKFSYNVFYGGLDILGVEVIKPDGKVIRHDAKAISKEQVDRSQMEANIYDPNDKILVAAVPDMEIGDVLRIFVKRWESKARMQGAYADLNMFEADMPIKDVTYEYIGPKDKPLVSKALFGKINDTVTATEKAEGEKIRYTWTGRNIPQYFAEPSMPEISSVGQRLLVSTLADWKQVSRWYYELCKAHLEKTTPAIKEKTAALTAGTNTDEEKIRAIFKFVSQEIRYMGITTEKDAPGYEPHNVDITFDNRYGVCRDKAALLAAMLSEAGYPAFPVLIMVGDKLNPEVPSPSFNHAITAARMKDGKYLLMDSTNESAADLLPQYLYNRSYLVATPEGEPLMTSPVSPVENNMALVKTVVKLADSGSADGTTMVDLTGINDVAYRGSLAQIKPDEARRFFEGVIKSKLAGATLTRFKIEPEYMQDTSAPIRISMDWSIPSILVSGGGVAQLDLPFSGYELGVAMEIIGKSLELDHRRFPLQTDYTCGVREDLEIQLPPSLEKPVSLPQYENTDHKDFSISQTIGAESGVLKSSLDIRLKSPEISPNNYLLLKKAIAKLQTNSRQQPVFVRKSDATATPAATADVEILSSRYAMRMENATTWSTRQEVRKKVLTYGGMKSNSELKLDFNPVWENVELEYAQVTQKDGTVRKIKTQEMNTLDAEWVASAPRYPGAKTLVVSLPGVEIGSLIEYAIKRTTKDQPMFCSGYAFTSGDAIESTELSYDFPADINPQLVMDFPKDGHMTEEKSAGRRRITFKWNGIKPQIREPQTPPGWLDAPDFALSTGNWQQYAMAVARQIEPLVENQANTVAKSRELTAGKSAPLEKIRAIRDFVARQIRAAGPGFTDFPLALAFSAADVTLKDGYGHDSDRAILLWTLLKSAGFQAELALASEETTEPTLLKHDLDIPNNGYFSSLVCRVKHPETGDWLPLDEIDQYAPLGATRLDGQPGYTLDGNAFTWAAPDDMRNQGQSHIDLDFDTEGTAVITFTDRFHGIGHASFVAAYSEMTPEERDRNFQQLVSGVAQNAVAQGKLVTDFTYPGTRKYSVKVEHFGVKSGKGLYFDLPGVPDRITSVSSSHRERALLVQNDTKSHTEWSVTATAGLNPVIQPETLDWRGPGNFGSIQFNAAATQEHGKSRLTYTLDLDLNPALVPTGNYSDLLEMNRRFSHSSARRVLLE